MIKHSPPTGFLHLTCEVVRLRRQKQPLGCLAMAQTDSTLGPVYAARDTRA
jgi:hypothetical protein